jgi:hypothetical protein
MSSIVRWRPAVLAVGLMVAACTGGGTPSPSAAPSQAPTPTPAGTAAATVEPTPTEMPGTKSFSVGFTNASISSAPFMAALDALNQQGYNIEMPIIESSELVNAAMSAVEQGANIRLIISRVANEWSLYAANDIKACADLNGRKLAIHSEGAVSTAMVRNYIAEKCPEAKPSYLIVPGSDNRLAALLADQIDASPVELGDGVTLDLQASDRYHLLTSFANDLPNLQTTSVYVNAAWAKENPGSVLAVVKSMLEVYRQVDGNAALLKQYSEKFVPDTIRADTIDAATQKYVELKMFPVNGGITAENLAYTAKFFGPKPEGTGATQQLMAVDSFADLSYLKLALEELGTK